MSVKTHQTDLSPSDYSFQGKKCGYDREFTNFVI